MATPPSRSRETSIFQACKETILNEPFHRFTGAEVFLQVTDAFHDAITPVFSIDPNSKWGPIVNRSVSSVVYMIAFPYFSYFALAGALFQGGAFLYRWKYVDTESISQDKILEHYALKKLHLVFFIQECALFALSLIKAHYLIYGVIGAIGSKLFLQGIQQWELALERHFCLPAIEDSSIWRKPLREAVPELTRQMLEEAPLENLEKEKAEAPTSSGWKNSIIAWVRRFFSKNNS